MIDTSTTAGKIEVMQASLDGKIIQTKHKVDVKWVDTSYLTFDLWGSIDHRIKPQTLKEAAKESAKIMFTNENNRNAYQAGFGDGSRWQKDQDNE